MADYTTYTLTGDILVDRAHWKAAGCPADHPYLVDSDGVYRQPPKPATPLALGFVPEVVDAMMSAVAAMKPAFDEANRRNVAAMLGAAR